MTDSPQKAGSKKPTQRRTLLLGLIGTAAFFVLWQVAVKREWLNPALFPSPFEIGEALMVLWSDNQVQRDTAASLGRIASGYALGSAVGIVLGGLLGRSATLLALSNPLLQMARAIPALALVPLVIFWFGLGELSKILLIAWASFFP